MPVTDKDRDILTRTLWGEARGEGVAGQIAVARTIRNRVFDSTARSWWCREIDCVRSAGRQGKDFIQNRHGV